MKVYILRMLLSSILIMLCACSANEEYTIKYYHPAYRKFAPAPVYSRVMWSHLPGPIQPKTGADEAPYLLPEVRVDLPDSTLKEAVEALAQTMGYRWEYPSKVATIPVHIRMDGTIDEVLREIGRQAGVYAMFDHQRRLIRIVEAGMLPQLPEGS